MLIECQARLLPSLGSFDHGRKMKIIFYGRICICLMFYWWWRRNCLKRCEDMLRSVKAQAIICAVFMHIKP